MIEKNPKQNCSKEHDKRSFFTEQKNFEKRYSKKSTFLTIVKKEQNGLFMNDERTK